MTYQLKEGLLSYDVMNYNINGPIKIYKFTSMNTYIKDEVVPTNILRVIIPQKESCIKINGVLISNSLMVAKENENYTIYCEEVSSVKYIDINRDFFSTKDIISYSLYQIHFKDFYHLSKAILFFQSIALNVTIDNEKKVKLLSELVLEILNEKKISCIKEETPQHFKSFKKIKYFIEENYLENLSVNDIAKHFSISERTLRNIFYNTISIAPKQYMKIVILHKALEEMTKFPEMKITEHVNNLLLPSSSLFAKEFKRFFKLSPKEYKELQKLFILPL